MCLTQRAAFVQSGDGTTAKLTLLTFSQLKLCVDKGRTSQMPTSTSVGAPLSSFPGNRREAKGDGGRKPRPTASPSNSAGGASLCGCRRTADCRAAMEGQVGTTSKWDSNYPPAPPPPRAPRSTSSSTPSDLPFQTAASSDIRGWGKRSCLQNSTRSRIRSGSRFDFIAQTCKKKLLN